jgi:hypothetical protein
MREDGMFQQLHRRGPITHLNDKTLSHQVDHQFAIPTPINAWQASSLQESDVLSTGRAKWLLCVDHKID